MPGQSRSFETNETMRLNNGSPEQTSGYRGFDPKADLAARIEAAQKADPDLPPIVRAMRAIGGYSDTFPPAMVSTMSPDEKTS